MGEADNILFPVIAVGVALGGLILTSSRGLRQEMTQMDARLRSDMNRLHEGMSHLRGDMTRLGERVTRIEHGQTRLEEHMTRLDDHVARLEHGQARLQGLLEGLREAITGRIASSCGPRAAKRGQSGCDSRPLVCAPMPQLIPIPQPILLERIYG